MIRKIMSKIQNFVKNLQMTFNKIVEEIKVDNFGKKDFERIFLEIDKIYYQNKYPYKSFVTPKARFSRKVCFHF